MDFTEGREEAKKARVTKVIATHRNCGCQGKLHQKCRQAIWNMKHKYPNISDLTL